MPTLQRFGPSLGEGTAIIDKTGSAPIQDSPLGCVGWACLLERGDTTKVIEVGGLADLEKKTGGLIPEGFGPDNARDYWALSEGAGRMLLRRITDGSEVKAYLKLYGRQAVRQLVGRLDAKNGGGWGGRQQTWVTDITTVATDIGETYVDLPIAFSVLKNQFAGGTLTLTGSSGGSGDTWNILSNAASDGIAKTRITLEADSTADTNYGAATDPECIIKVPSKNAWAQDRYLAAEILDGAENPSTEWGLIVYLNGNVVLSYPNLSSDPASSRYWVDVINEDGNNEYVTATDLWVGGVSATMRPANFYGTVPTASIAATLMQLKDLTLIVDSSAAGSNTIGSFTFGAEVIPDTYVITYDSGGGDWTVVSSTQQATHAFPNATTSAYAADNPQSIGFTITENTPSNGEAFTITVLPLVENHAIGGRIFYEGVSGAPNDGFPISANTETTLTATNYDLTIGATIPATVPVRVQYPQQFSFGYDGIANVDTTDFTQAFDVNSSLFNDMLEKGYGLIKFAAPGVTLQSGVTATTVEKAGAAYASAKNHQYRYEIPSTITDNFAARDHVHTTLGRNQRTKATFPNFAYVPDSVRRGRLKLIPITGMIQGREAKFAKDRQGYHGVAAGEHCTLPRIVKLQTGVNSISNAARELLNPAGIQSVGEKKGNFVHWGGRIPTDNASYTFGHHREMMSHYGHTLQYSVDAGLFTTGDNLGDVVAAVKAYFKSRWDNGELEGSTLEEAVVIKWDGDINTPLTKAAGDSNIEVKPKLVNMRERLNITLNKEGAFENEAL